MMLQQVFTFPLLSRRFTCFLFYSSVKRRVDWAVSLASLPAYFTYHLFDLIGSSVLICSSNFFKNKTPFKHAM